MARITDLPDEIKLNIAHRLKQTDLKALALTASHCRGAAQECLFACISLVLNWVDLPQILRTLVQKPSLASKIRKLRMLDVSPPQEVEQRGPSGLEFWDEIVTGAKTVTQKIPWSMNKNTWILKVTALDFHASIGLLLLLLPRLEELRSTTIQGLEQLCLSGVCSYSPTASTIPFLPELRVLSAPPTKLEKSWLRSPNLRHLHITYGTSFKKLRPKVRFSGIDTLTIEFSRWDGNSNPGPRITDVVQRFPDLRSLHLVCNGNCGYANDFDWSIFHCIIEDLPIIAPLLERLERLEVRHVGPKGEYHNRVHYSRLLSKFTQLKTLAISQGQMIRIVEPLHPFDTLPPNLEHLELEEPTTDIVKWLSGVLDDRSKLCSLKKVSLNFGDDPKQRPADYEEAGVEILPRLLKAGIEVRFKNVHISSLGKLMRGKN
jgi:hypothetical protein